MELIAKLFIKDYKDTKNPTVRFRYGTTAGIIGIVVIPFYSPLNFWLESLVIALQ